MAGALVDRLARENKGARPRGFCLGDVFVLWLPSSFGEPFGVLGVLGDVSIGSGGWSIFRDPVNLCGLIALEQTVSAGCMTMSVDCDGDVDDDGEEEEDEEEGRSEGAGEAKGALLGVGGMGHWEMPEETTGEEGEGGGTETAMTTGDAAWRTCCCCCVLACCCLAFVFWCFVWV